MADAQDAISRLQIQTSAPGTDEAADSMNALAQAYGAVTVASAATEKSTASLDSKFASIERRLVDGVKAQQDYAKIQSTVNAAVAQNPALTDRANAVLAAAKQRYDEATGSQSLFEKGLESAKDKATELTSELGPMGSALRAIGPIGLAVGAAVGVAILALDKLKEQAEEAGRWATQLQNAANVIGINTVQLQGLNEAAASVGVSASDNIAAFEKFSVSLGQLRDGTGSLYTQLQKVNPSLVNQLSVTKDSATAWNLLAQAYAQADKQQQALIARAAFGRGGAAEGGVLLATANAGGIAGLQAANSEDAISQEQIKRWAQLTVQINSATEAASHNFQSIFTTQILTSEKNFAENMLAISQYAKAFTVSEDWKKFTDFISSPSTSTVLGAVAKVLIPLPLQVAGAAVSSLFTSHGAGAGSPSAPSALPPAPNFDATFSAVDKSNTAATAASLGVQATQAKALVAALGSVATAQEHLDATTKQLNVDLANHTITQETYNRAIQGARLDAAIAAQSAYMSALGASATVADVVAAKQLQLQKLQLQNPQITDAMIQKQLALTASQTLGTFHIDAQTDAEKVKIATLTMSTQAATAYQIVQTKINEAIAAGHPLTADQIAQLQQSADAFAKAKTQADTYSGILDTLKSSGASFATDLVSGLRSGNSLMSSLGNAARNLSTALTTKAFTDLFSGNYVQAGIEGVGAIVSGLFGDDEAEKEKEQQQRQQALQRQQQFQVQAQQALVDQSTLSGQLQAFDLQAQQQREQEQQAGGQAMVDLEKSLAVQRLAIVNKSVTDSRTALQALGEDSQSSVVQQLTAVQKAGNALNDALKALGSSTAEVATDVAAAVAKVKASFDADLQSKINTATGKGYLNDLQSLIDQRTQLLGDSAALGSNPSQVATYFSAAAQSIVDGAQLTGDAFNSLLAQFPQLTGVVHQFTGSLKDLQDQISQYLASLRTGSLSTLSPEQKLAAAAQTFQQTLAAVQGGDTSKAGQLTSSASDYLTQAQNFFASSAGYSSIYDAVTSALQNVAGISAFSSSTSTLGSSTTSVSSAAGVPGVVMPQAAAANDNTAQYFQTQTTALSQVFAQVGQAQIVALQTGVADLGKRLDRIAVAVEGSRGKPLRPSDKAAA
jgi:hypothetical protein